MADNKDYSLPVYVLQYDNRIINVIPLQGTGLWGPIWGYMALSEDFDTVIGTVFDHKSETPGLGAEITTENSQINSKTRDYSKTVFSSLLLSSKAESPHLIQKNKICRRCHIRRNDNV